MAVASHRVEHVGEGAPFLEYAEDEVLGVEVPSLKGTALQYSQAKHLRNCGCNNKYYAALIVDAELIGVIIIYLSLIQLKDQLVNSPDVPRIIQTIFIEDSRIRSETNYIGSIGMKLHIDRTQHRNGRN